MTLLKPGAYVISAAILAATLAAPPAAYANSADIEPGAVAWKTWVVSSGKEYRLPAPPNEAASEAEMKLLKEMAARRDAAALDNIAFWDTGAPPYRWNAKFVAEALKRDQGQHHRSQPGAIERGNL
jgi:hypothetical protein